MSRSIPRGVVRLVAKISQFSILCSVVALLLFDLRELTTIRSQLRTMDSRIIELSRDTPVAVAALSGDLKDLSLSVENEFAVARHRTGGDVSRIGNRLSGRLDEMAGRLDLIMSESQSLGSVRERLDAMSEKLQWVSSGPGSTRGPDGAALYEIDTRMHAQELEANTLFDKGHYKEASSKFAMVLEKQPANMDVRLKRAVSMFRANPSDTFAYPTIERELKSALETRGESPMALEVLGLLATERREWSTSSEYFRRLLAIAPHNVSYLKEACESSLYGGDFDSAKAYAEEALRILPQDAEAVALAVRARDCSLTGGPR